MPNQGLKELYIEELKDLYNAETQLVKALPKLARAATSEDLRRGFEHHLEQTKGHVERLQKIFDMLEESPKGHPVKVCLARELRVSTPMTRAWIAERLCMGSASYLSALLSINSKN